MTGKKMTKAQEKELAAEAKAVEMYAEDAGQGFEEFDEDSTAIPRLKILQKSSPECDEDLDEFIEGAKPGMLINSVTKELYSKDNAISVIPCAYDKRFNIWIPREAGGGLVESMPWAKGKEFVRDLPRDDKGIPITPEDYQVIDTREHFFLILKEDGMVEAVVSSFTSTKVKKSKAWGTLMSLARFPTDPTFKPPMWAFVYNLSTILQTKDQYTYYNWDIQRAFPTHTLENGPDLIMAAKIFHDAVMSGERVAVPEDDTVIEAETY